VKKEQSEEISKVNDISTELEKNSAALRGIKFSKTL
jgi:hypothetical protein